MFQLDLDALDKAPKPPWLEELMERTNHTELERAVQEERMKRNLCPMCGSDGVMQNKLGIRVCVSDNCIKRIAVHGKLTKKGIALWWWEHPKHGRLHGTRQVVMTWEQKGRKRVRRWWPELTDTSDPYFAPGENEFEVVEADG